MSDQNAKQKIIYLLIITIAIIIVLLILLVGLLAFNSSLFSKATNVATPSNLVAASNSVASTNVITHTNINASPNLDEVFNPKMLGVSYEYFKSIAGIPKYVGDEGDSFMIDGCEIEVRAGDSVGSLSLEVTPECQPNVEQWSYYFGEISPKKEHLTGGDFDSLGEVYCDCLYMCGNAYDPALYIHNSGYRANGWTEVMVKIEFTSDEAIEAASKWEVAMERIKGRDWIIDNQFNCSHEFDNLAKTLFKDVPITSVSIGRNFRIPTCMDD